MMLFIYFKSYITNRVLIPGDTNFRWLHRQADLLIKSDTLYLFNQTGLQYIQNQTGNKAPIIMYGYYTFKLPNYKGENTNFYYAPPSTLLYPIKHKKFKLPERIVLMGSMNENQGFLSTHVLNRTW